MTKETQSKIQWQEHDLDQILRYFAKDFTGVASGTVKILDVFIDRQRGKVIFKLLIA